VTTLSGQTFSVASIEAEKSFRELCPRLESPMAQDPIELQVQFSDRQNWTEKCFLGPNYFREIKKNLMNDRK